MFWNLRFGAFTGTDPSVIRIDPQGQGVPQYCHRQILWKNLGNYVIWVKCDNSTARMFSGFHSVTMLRPDKAREKNELRWISQKSLCRRADKLQRP